MDGKHPKKYAPKKVFVLENNNYIEISYEELCERAKLNKDYKTKLFLPLHGMLMEVTTEDYQRFYREEHRQRYLRRLEEKHGVVSYDRLTTDELSGENVLHGNTLPVEDIVEIRLMIEKLRKSLSMLRQEDWKLIDAIYFKGLSERQWSVISGIPQRTVNRQKQRILAVLKKSLEKL